MPPRCNVCAVQWYCISRCLCGCIQIGVCLDEGAGDPVSLKVASVQSEIQKHLSKLRNCGLLPLSTIFGKWGPVSCTCHEGETVTRGRGWRARCCTVQ